MKRRVLSAHAVALAFVVLLGAGLRLYRIGELPPGLYRDEAFYGLDALRVLEGDWSLYFVANNGREGLFMYPLALSIAIFGRTPEALRLTSAAIGTLTILALYAAGRAIFSPRVGLLGAAILATTFWHLALSRLAFRAILLPLMACTVVALWFFARRSSASARGLLFSAAGFAFGLTFYTYTAAPLIVGLLLPAVLFEHRRCRVSLLFWAGAAVSLSPFVFWLAQHADFYFNRPGQVSLLNPAIHQGDLLGALMRSALKTLGMFFIAGDRIWRHNLPELPVFVGPMAALFALGVLVAARRWRQQPFGFVLLWLGLFLVPTVLAEDVPHYLRAVGALPPACLLAALGMAAVIDRFPATRLPMRLDDIRPKDGLILVLALGLLPQLVLTTHLYFNRYVTAPVTGYWLEAHNVALAQAVNAAAARGEQVRIDTRLSSDNPALHFLSPAVAYVADMGGYLWLPGDETRGRLFVDPNHDWSALRDALPSPMMASVQVGPMAQADREPAPRRAFIDVSFSTALPATDALAQFEGGMNLLYAAVACAAKGEDGCQVSLRWQIAQPRADDLAVFVHWLRDGQLVAQSDGTPGSGYLPVYFWRAGDGMSDTYVLRGAQWQVGDTIHVGLYRRQDLSRLRVLRARTPATSDSVIITTSGSK